VLALALVLLANVRIKSFQYKSESQSVDSQNLSKLCLDYVKSNLNYFKLFQGGYMGKKKPGLTKEEHKKLGEELLIMRQRLSAILIQLSKAYPKATYLADQAYKAVDHLRCEFDNLVLVEHPAGESAEKN
jgi:hypothetical protein